ncbi:MAG: glycohydrolase toxin TNT-related protein [Cytophagaceae bacterium]|nr:glycohydrolase toxin TNT-related protein [Cytophagaceae bacterium]MBK9933362.1 glycohydrolase toxin TNT-related protein [Cytophagaceae bacterium]MBL0302922.1 glycohydrolase toxin TNT-related protein [Cytophagaceae bacterium]MBL0325752.1 glycohydrolase toxin TNT-related protein [Cytophagaceae bacterium]
MIDVYFGQIIPWFGQPGGSTQYLLPDGITNLKVDKIIEIF